MPPAAGTLYVLPMEDGTEALRHAFETQWEAVALWWERPPPDGPGFVRVAPTEPVTDRHGVECFLASSGIREAEADVPLVLYVTGHGVTSAAAKHFAVLRDTDTHRLLATGLRTTEIVVAALDSYARDVLVIVNMCESADLAGELLELSRDLSTARTTYGTLNVLVTAAPKMRVLSGEFAMVLARAHEWLRTAGGITRRYLTVSEFSRALYQATRALGEELGRVLSVDCSVVWGKLHVPTAALPNPGHRPEIAAVEDSRREVAASPDDLEYWLEKASGRPGAQDAGWYFSGREPLNAAVVAFLSGSPGVLLVTGVTASGKSAILGRAVTLSDARFRGSQLFAEAVRHCPEGTVPQEGAVTIAITARHREALTLLQVVCQRLGVTPDPSGRDRSSRWQAGLRKFLDAPGPPVTIVVDSLDEASEPSAALYQALVPLADHLSARPAPDTAGAADAAGGSDAPRRGVRLVVAVRSTDPGTDGGGARSDPDDGQDLLGRLQEAFPGAVVLRTDDADMGEDVRGYVRALLHGEPAWAGHDLDEPARTVAAAVGRSFLDARVAAGQLRTAGPRLLTDRAWLAGLGEGTTGLLRADLARAPEDGLAADEALALLRATAFARGRGIAWGEVWPAVASALLGRTLEDADDKIRTLLGGRLAGYLTRDVQEDQRVYRPAHERLAAVLRAWRGAGDAPGGRLGMTGDQLDVGDAEGAPGDGAGRDDGRAYASDGGARDAAYEATRDEAPQDDALQDEADAPDDADASGGTDAYEADADAHARIARALAELAAPHTAGADGTAPHPYVRQHLARHARLGGVLDDAHVPADFLPWLTGSPLRGLLGLDRGREDRRRLEAWAAVEPYLHRAGHVSRLASLHLAYTALRSPGPARPRTPEEAEAARRAPLDVLWSRWAPPVNVLATLDTAVRSLTALTAPDGRGVLAVGDTEGGIELLDAVDGTTLRERVPGHEGEVRHLLGARRPGQSALLVSGSTDGTVRLWDFASGDLVDQVHRPGDIWIADVCAYVDGEGELAVLCVNGNGRVVWWNDRMGPQELPGLPGEVPRTTTPRLTVVRGPDGRPLLAVADGDALVFRDAETSAEVARFELPGTVRVLVAASAGTVAAGHADGSVTLWDTSGPGASLTGAVGPVSALVPLELDGRRLLAASSGRDIAVWDTAAPGPPGLLRGHDSSVTALAPLVSAEATTLASASTDGTLRLWHREALGRVLDVPGAAAGGSVEPVPSRGALSVPGIGDAAGPAWFALGNDQDARIEVRDIGSGEAVALLDVGRPATALTWARRAGGRVLVTAADEDHSIRLWDADGHRFLPGATGAAEPAGAAEPEEPLEAPEAAGILEGHILPVRCLAAWTGGDGRNLLLSGGDDERVRLWDLDRAAPLRAWAGHGMRVRAVAAAAAPNGAGPDLGPDLLVSAGADGTVRLWDPEHGPVGAPLRCDQGVLNAVTVNADPLGGLPPYVASAGDTGTVRLWDLRERRPLGDPLTGHGAAVHALTSWNTEGQGSFVASGSADGTVRVWDAAGGRCRLLLAVGSPVRALGAHPGASGGRVVLSFTGDAGAAVVEVDLARCRAGEA
ncbi:AAA family ATPase [Streptomyces sp. NPDC048606]|uniref:AAA family ATPase n=1 Tax=Streptomyces sp. NPDC048606 TaxID=3154726 RepID=UPI00341281E9